MANRPMPRPKEMAEAELLAITPLAGDKYLSKREHSQAADDRQARANANQ